MFLAVKFLIAELVALLIFPDPSVFCFNVILQAGFDYSETTDSECLPIHNKRSKPIRDNYRGT